ncbi:hypothetical protein [Streptomyces sp. NPDC058855]|uniref:hypothetical protein n=1 Tax=Streptomyces sp. NPDC058855 TaxID=3346651 RepID=UPI0036D1673B
MSKQRSEMDHRPRAAVGEPEETDERGGTGEPDERDGDREAWGTGQDRERGGRARIDLSVAQVSGSALAAVIAAKLASTLGVYGTIVGAGVISVIATCGGPVFQHLLKRTGEQVRDATAAVKPKPRQPGRRTARGRRPAEPERADARALVPGAVAPGGLPADGTFGRATTHGTRMRGWKRPALAAALVFGVTMGGITAYELVSGEDFGGTKGRTTFGSVVRGGGDSGPDTSGRDGTPAPASSEPARDGDGDGRPDGGATPGGDAPSAPDGRATSTPGTGTGPASPAPEPTPGGTTGPTGSTGTDPAPDPEPTGPAPTTAPTGPAEPTAPTAPTEAPVPEAPGQTLPPRTAPGATG